MLKTIGTIAIPDAAGSDFDHAAFDAKSRRVFIAHTARDCIEVIDHDAGRHLATLPGFPGAAGAVADDGQILVTNRGSTPFTFQGALVPPETTVRVPTPCGGGVTFFMLTTSLRQRVSFSAFDTKAKTSVAGRRITMDASTATMARSAG